MTRSRTLRAPVVGLLDEYLDEVEEFGDGPFSAEFDSDDLLVIFSREVYNQFFEDILGHPVGELPGHASRVRTIQLRAEHREEWSFEVDAVVHGYLKFCPLYQDLLAGLHYERAEAIALFHLGFVPKFLDELFRWAASVPDAELVKNLGRARHRYAALVEDWKARRHD